MNIYFRFRHFKTLALVLFPISISLLGCKGGGIADGADLSRAENSSSELAPYIPKGPLTFGPSSVFQVGAITKAIGAQANEHCRSVTTDKSGNIYCVGSTEGNLGETNGGMEDAFLAKWSPNGNLSWVKQIGAITKNSSTSGNDVCLSVKLDSFGNIYCGGYTDGNLGEINGGGTDAFIAKWNASGTLQWVKQFGAVTKPNDSIAFDSCNSITIDSADNIYCGGTTFGSLGERNGWNDATCTGNRCNSDAFVSKWDKNGILKWVKQIGHVTKPFLSKENDECRSIAVDSKDNIYCGGITNSSLGEMNGSGNINGSGAEDILIFKLTNQGGLVWIKQVGQDSAPLRSLYTESCESISIDRVDNVYCSGFTNASFGEISGGFEDVILVKWNSNGNLQWIKQMGGETKPYDTAGVERCYSMTVDQAGSVYCAGHTTGSLDETNGGNEDTFISKWNSAGTLIWTKQLGNVTKNNKSNGYDRCYSLAIDSSNNLICAGSTTGPLGETNGGGYDAFIWIQPDGR